jgi:hypothetical protein
MTHVQLHHELSEAFNDLKDGKMKDKRAHELSNMAGKLIKLDELALKSIALGIPRDVPLLGIKQIEAEASLNMAGKLIAAPEAK